MQNMSAIERRDTILQTPIEYLKGVGPLRAQLLQKEVRIFTFHDLLTFYPFKHIDRTRVTPISQLNVSADYAQVQGKVISLEKMGEGRARRFVVILGDSSGQMELVWFRGIHWIEKMLSIAMEIRVFGRVAFFQNIAQMAHPEFEAVHPTMPHPPSHMEPVYPSTEKLKAKGLGGRELGKLTECLLKQLKETDVPENIPEDILKQFNLLERHQAIKNIHFPEDTGVYQRALTRLKFEELFLSQLRLGLVRTKRYTESKGYVFQKVGTLFHEFYHNHLPFNLTSAQKRVLKEIRKDVGSGRQMNRLLQGDVGSGKTLVALMAMLMAADNGYQSCFMAPTEILARQHYATIKSLLREMDVKVIILTGSSKRKERNAALEGSANGEFQIVIGTHALIEDTVVFKNLGLAIIDEQHRFGVEQRAKLWKKNTIAPHILVMTATPIPRTLALTAYGDLDYSIMDELPPGRKPVTTVHRVEYKRPQVMDFVKSEIAKGRQVYLLYPLIEESASLDYENLMKGYEEVKAYFPEPKYYISMVHGKQRPVEKEVNMNRFVTGDTQIMVSTTVIEVGVNVPNATVMVIESAEKFGLTQLHQLRGRVGRGSEKSYCILMTKMKLSDDARQRLSIMCQTNDGFKIAEKDLEIRGPGEIEGTRQSGEMNFKLADIMADRKILEAARVSALKVIEEDASLALEKHQCLKVYLQSTRKKSGWSKIS